MFTPRFLNTRWSSATLIGFSAVALYVWLATEPSANNIAKFHKIKPGMTKAEAISAVGCAFGNYSTESHFAWGPGQEFWDTKDLEWGNWFWHDVWAFDDCTIIIWVDESDCVIAAHWCERHYAPSSLWHVVRHRFRR